MIGRLLDFIFGNDRDLKQRLFDNELAELDKARELEQKSNVATD